MREAIIPQPLKGEMKVELQLPPEVLTILTDLHGDRQYIGFGGVLIVGCLVLITLKHLLTKKS